MTLFGLVTVCSECSFVLPVPTESIGGRCDGACGFLGLGRDEGDLPARLGEIVEAGDRRNMRWLSATMTGGKSISEMSSSSDIAR